MLSHTYTHTHVVLVEDPDQNHTPCYRSLSDSDPTMADLILYATARTHTHTHAHTHTPHHALDEAKNIPGPSASIFRVKTIMCLSKTFDYDAESFPRLFATSTAIGLGFWCRNQSHTHTHTRTHTQTHTHAHNTHEPAPTYLRGLRSHNARVHVVHSHTCNNAHMHIDT